MLNNLHKLAQLGQSPWYDNMERGLIENGELEKIFTQGILGVTTNPSIFEKAINNSKSYDKDIATLKEAGKAPLEIYDDLTLHDVALAADLLLKTYERTSGVDGYVSLEVLPEYAHDAQKTIENARRLFSILKRKNIMIKIPSTKEGCMAIKELISEGININATLIFSLSQYEAVANAYIDGINDGVKKGKDLSKVHSVASIFVSRLDSKVDSELQKILSNGKDADIKNVIKNLLGKTAVANIKIIYSRYKELFSNKKINPQRVLWASTSTKNPE
ncbi:transaldolase, partial [Candidatus Desantisbacteria bacterium]|nr:transaldolase [Candidatus Desantisbacteria bacterium]